MVKNTKKSKIELVSQAYVFYLMHTKKITTQEPIVLDTDTKQRIYQLYKLGLLPIQIGGLG
jgi:hypothetical protein